MSYYQENKEAVSLQHKDYYRENREKILKRVNKRYAEQKDQILEQQKIYLSKDEIKSSRHAYYLNKNHGISLDQYNDLLAEQNGVCAICQTDKCLTGKKLAVDHCHETGRIRGILCSRCNNGLGRFEDSIKLLQRAIEYLQGENDV